MESSSTASGSDDYGEFGEHHARDRPGIWFQGEGTDLRPTRIVLEPARASGPEVPGARPMAATLSAALQRRNPVTPTMNSPMSRRGARARHAGRLDEAALSASKGRAIMQHISTTAPSPGNDDRATWALVALVAVLLAGGVGWVVAYASGPSWDDVSMHQQTARHEGALEGRQRGWSEGARTGRREGRIRGDYERLRETQTAFSSGWNRGYQDGRDRAQARADGYDTYVGGAGGYDAYPPASFEDVELALTDLQTDTPGYATSSLSGVGSSGMPGSSAGTDGLTELYRR